MAAAEKPVLVDKMGARSTVWKYFGFKPNDKGQPLNLEAPQCKRCYKVCLAKGGKTSNLSKHLKDNHADLFKDFSQERQVIMLFTSSLVTPPTQKQPTLQDVFQQHMKYPKDSEDAKRLNRAVAEFICMDQVPIYSVEKAGFRNLVHNLDKKYDLPSRNFFMYNEIPKIYDETRSMISAQLAEKPFFACTTDLWTSRTASAYMAVTLQYITKAWEIESWCLGCSALQSDHTAESLKEALEDIVIESWGLDMTNMSGITTDNASNNRKAFADDFNWIPCFGHNLDLAVKKAIAIDRVASSLSRLRNTISAFSRSNKMTRMLKEKQASLNLPQHKLIHDEPTRWGSTYDMVERFCEQQQAVSAVLADDRKKWHLMPRDSDMTILETVRDVLAPLSEFTDALSGEKEATLSSVLPLIWKIRACLEDEEGDSPLMREMKHSSKQDFEKRYDEYNLKMTLNIATFLDPRFKNMFVTMEEQVKMELLLKVDTVHLPREHSQEQQEESVDDTGAATSKKKRSDLKSLLCSIASEKKGADTRQDSATPMTTPSDKLQYLCIPASSCASERVFSTSGNICSPRRSRLTEENVDTLVFLARNLKKEKK
uniref:BED-type domain-containing protein n=1 Tax=Seriola dumerili TaxID=41447 RepID=A0A3B4U3F6_SERDU